MHTKYNYYAVMKNKIKALEEQYATETSENAKKRLFWEIEKAQRQLWEQQRNK